MRTYSVTSSKVGVTTAIDLFELTPNANKPVEICGLFITQSSDFGDAQSEIIPYKVIRGHSTSGSGGAAPTPRPIEPNDTAAGFTAETNNTVIASAGAPVDLHASSFNVMVGEQLWLPDGFGWRTNATVGTIVVRLMTAPVDEIILSSTIYVRET